MVPVVPDPRRIKKVRITRSRASLKKAKAREEAEAALQLPDAAKGDGI